jgi:hypothetical protein
MSNLNHDTAARLLGITPGELEALVKSGAVRRVDRNAYALPVLVQDFIGHVKADRDRIEISPKQVEIATHLDMSERAVREFLDAASIDHKLASLSEIRVKYIRRLREIAAGRSSNGESDLVTERARLARAQADKAEMDNAERRGQLILAEAIEPKLKAAFVAAREKWLDAVGRLARELPAEVDAREAMLQHEFEGFLHRLATWSTADVIEEEGE